MALSYDEIAEILKIIDGSSCDELIVETGDIKLVVRRHGAGGAVATPQGSGASPVAAAPARAAPAAPPPRPSAPPPSGPAPIAKAPHQIEVTAPMVGTFYRSPSPDAAPFVEVGSVVRKGDPLCLIEVMKLFTTIAAEHDGRIAQIGAENTELVEYGRTLFLIDPA
ncbi:MAG TPA: acetyl-CoA carboxylase biotin carboxyl carrier protein [Xanthobacteraceae bacterium]|nr:acetyl-CoA carboxylase biotin carboxyl carrier protein [Xanthobacteraceae bacterium]